MILAHGKLLVLATMVLLWQGCIPNDLQTGLQDGSVSVTTNADMSAELSANCRWLVRASGIALCKGTFRSGEADKLCAAAAKNGRMCGVSDTLNSADTAACQAVNDGIYLLDMPSYHSPGTTQSAVCSTFSGWEAGLSGCGPAPPAYASKTVCKGWGISVVCSRSPSFTCTGGSLKTATNTDIENGIVCCLPAPMP